MKRINIVIILIIFIKSNTIAQNDVNLVVSRFIPILNSIITADEKYLITSNETSISIWDIRNGRQLRTFLAHGADILCLDVSLNQKMIVSSSKDRTVKVWDFDTGDLVFKFNGHKWPVNFVKFSPDGKYIFSRDIKNLLIVWETETGNIIRKIYEGNINKYSIDSSGNFILYTNQKVFLHNIKQTEPIKIFNTNNTVNSAFFVNNSKQLVTLCDDSSLFLWDIEKSKVIKKVNNSFKIENFFIQKKPYNIITYDESKNLVFWNINTLEKIKKLKINTDTYIDNNSFILNNRYFFVNYDCLIDIKNGRIVESKINSKKNLLSNPNQFVYNSKRNAIISYLGNCIVDYNLSTGNKSLNTIQISDDEIFSCFDKNGNYYLTLNKGLNVLKIIELKSNKVYKQIELGSDFDNISYTDNLILMYNDHECQIFDVNSEKIIYSKEFSESSITVAKISPSGSWFAIGFNNFEIYVENLKTRKSFTLKGHTIADLPYEEKLLNAFCTSINDLTFTNNEKYLISAASDRKAIVWDLQTQNQKTIFRNHTNGRFTGGVQSVIVLPDDQTVVSCAMDYTVRFWNINNANELYNYTLGSSVIQADAYPYKIILLKEFEKLGILSNTLTIIDYKGKEVINYLQTENGQNIWYTQDKYYFSSKDVTNSIYFVKGNKTYSFDQFDLQFNRPDIVLDRLGNSSPSLIESYRKAYQKRLRKMGFDPTNFENVFRLNAPEITIIDGSESIVETNQPNYKLKFTATDQLYNLDRYFITVNGVPIYGIKGKKFNTISKQSEIIINVPLSEGENIIKVSALNEKGVESYQEQIDIYYKPIKPTKPNLYLITIGVSNFKQADFNLRYAHKDAADIAKLFESKRLNYGSVKTFLLQNEFATRENILKLRKELLNTRPDDQVVLFIASHGLLDDNLDYYLATYDIDFNNPSARGLRYDELEGILDSIPARQKLVLIDACHSGEVDKEETELTEATKISDSHITSRGFKALKSKENSIDLKTSFELMKELFADLRRNNGSIIISSASGTELAYETATIKNGVFTFAVIEGLQKFNADFDRNKTITAGELRNYVVKRVSDLTNGRQNPTSRNENIDYDFTVWR